MLRMTVGFLSQKDSPFSLKWTRGKDYDISMDFRRGKLGMGAILSPKKPMLFQGHRLLNNHSKVPGLE